MQLMHGLLPVSLCPPNEQKKTHSYWNQPQWPAKRAFYLIFGLKDRKEGQILSLLLTSNVLKQLVHATPYVRRTASQHIFARYLKLLRNILGWFNQKLKTLHHGGCCSQKSFTRGNSYSKDRKWQKFSVKMSRSFKGDTQTYLKLQKQCVNPAGRLLTFTTDKWLNIKQIYLTDFYDQNTHTLPLTWINQSSRSSVLIQHTAWSTLLWKIINVHFKSKLFKLYLEITY